MAAAEADEPRLFAQSKKRRKHAASKPAVRSVESAEHHTTPTPGTLASSPSERSARPKADGWAAAVAAASIEHGGHTAEDDFEAQDAATTGAEQDATAAADDAAAGATADDDAAAAPLPVADTTFRALGVSEWLDRVCRSLGKTKPTQVQAGCNPAILAGRHAIGTAHTGSGKTAAFALPILQLLAAEPFGVFALVLTPTRFVSARALQCCQSIMPK